MDFYNKKILLLIHQGDLGGAERQGLGISKILTEKYHCEVNVLLTYSADTTEEFKKFADECHVKEIVFIEKPYLYCKKEFSIRNVKRLIWSLKYLWSMKKKLQQYEPEVLIPFLNFPSKLAFFLYKLLPSAKVVFWHQLGLDSISRDIFEYIAVKNVPFVIANAENGLEMFRKTYHVSSNKLNVLPQYVSISIDKNVEDTCMIEKSTNFSDKLVIGMVAHYRPEKRQELLLITFEKLRNHYPNIHLLFLGNKNQSENSIRKYEELGQLIKIKKMENSVSLLSGVKVQHVLSNMDIGVLVSEIEGVPNAVMEYMVYGLPVITTNHPGCVSLLTGSKYLINNNQEELYLALEELITSKISRSLEAERNREIIKSYNMEAYVEKLERIINKYI